MMSAVVTNMTKMTKKIKVYEDILKTDNTKFALDAVISTVILHEKQKKKIVHKVRARESKNNEE